VILAVGAILVARLLGPFSFGLYTLAVAIPVLLVALNGIADTGTVLKMSVVTVTVYLPLGPILATLWAHPGSSLHTYSPMRFRQSTDSVRLQ
jgi:hypothetical protein